MAGIAISRGLKGQSKDYKGRKIHQGLFVGVSPFVYIEIVCEDGWIAMQVIWSPGRTPPETCMVS